MYICFFISLLLLFLHVSHRCKLPKPKRLYHLEIYPPFSVEVFKSPCLPQSDICQFRTHLTARSQILDSTTLLVDRDEP